MTKNRKLLINRWIMTETNIINDNIVQEITETKDQDQKEKEVEKLPDMAKLNQLPKPFEDWLFKEPIPTTSKEVLSVGM